MQGIPVTEDLQALIRKENPGKAKRLRREREEAEAMIGICSSLLIPRNEEFLGGWLCFHCSPSLSEAASEELGVLLLLSDQACYFAHCNKELEVTDYSRIGLEDLQRIEIGRFPIIIKQSQTYFMRFHYTCTGKSGYQHTLRAGPQHHGHNPRGTGSHTLSLTHTLAPSHSPSSHTLSYTHLSLTLTHTHLSLSHSLTHTLSFTHTLPPLAPPALADKALWMAALREGLLSM
uniref:Phosphatidylinositide phosphatase SAC2-like n=1 Tax=Callorhinchus milii TaxID=7868 RepID=A0A4W3GZD6_CALMI